MRRVVLCIACVFLVRSALFSAEPSGAQLEEKRARDLLEKGDMHYQVREFDEAVEIYRKVIDQYPRTKARYSAHLRLGRHFFKKKDYETAIDHLHSCAEGSTVAEEVAEALYLKGLCYYERKEYAKAFYELRKVTSQFPGSEYANKSYFYIGMGHYYLKHYKPAIEAFQMVGTSISESDPAIKKLTPGHRLFIKVNDKDLAVLSRQKKNLKVSVQAKSGDKETVELQPRGVEGIEFIGSIKTRLGEPEPEDGTLQVLGNDTINVTYLDTHAANKKRDVPRIHTITMASDAVVDFVDGVYKERVQGVTIGKQASIRVVDYDKDLSKAPEKVTVVVRSKIEIPPTEEEKAKAELEGKELERKFKLRDEVKVELTELDYVPGELLEEGAEKEETKATEKLYHTGIFVGSVKVEEGEANKNDNILQAEMHDVLEVEYVDEIRVQSEKPETLRAEVVALKGQLSVPQPFGTTASSEKLRVRVELQVADALMNMGRIYKELGLKKQANERFEEALRECFKVSREPQAKYDKELQGQIQYLLWKIYFEKEDYQKAAQMCLTLLRTAQESSEFADDALMAMGDMAEKREEYLEAISYYKRLLQFVGVLRKPKEGEEKKVIRSPLAPEALYKIAQCYEKMAEKNRSYNEQALLTYRQILETFPMSKWAPEAILKIATYYKTIKDYPRALETYEKALRDYPDAEFLDTILFEYGKTLVLSKDYAKSLEVFNKLMEDYPESKHIKRVRRYIPYIQRRLKRAKSE